jgi:hypothetical protein
MIMHRIWLGLAASGFMLAAPADAIVLTPVVTGQSGSNSFNGPGSQKFISSSGMIATSSTGSDPDRHGASSNVLTIGVGATKITSETHVSSVGASNANAGSNATLIYYFSVNGPTPTVLIEMSVLVEMSRSAFAYNPAYSYTLGNQNQYAEVTLRDDKNHIVFGGIAQSRYVNSPNSTMYTSGIFTLPGTASNTTNPINQAYSNTILGSKTGTINTNQQYAIHMLLQNAIGFAQYYPLTGSAYASLSNLSVKLASSVPNPSNYQLDFGNSAAVPEPNSWALLIVGFGLTGAMMRRKYPMVARA